MENQEQFRGGLLPTPPDNRDFQFRKLFGAINTSLFPDNFIVRNPIKIKNQGDTDFCTAFALTAVSEIQEEIELDPLWQFAKIKQLEGNWETWGADLRMACKSAVKFGSLPEGLSPYHLDDKNRDFLANWANWDSELDLPAQYHEKKTYWSVDNGFEGFRMALYLNKTAILTGVLWCNEWTYSEGGIINKKGTPTEGHSLAVIGWKTINNALYLVVQNSYGDDVGDKGLYYFHRDLVDKMFIFGGFAFVDLSPEEAKKLAWSLRIKIMEKIKNILTKISIALNELLKLNNYDRIRT